MIKFCKKCNAETERAERGVCIPCTKIYNANYHAKNKNNHGFKEKIKAYSIEYYKKNADKKKAYARNWLFENKARALVTKSAYRKANPEQHKIGKHNRKAKILLSGGTLSKGLSAKLFKLQNGKCACCSKPLGNNFHLDHIMPLALGGCNDDRNIQLLTGTCNLQKNAKHPVDFMQQRGFLI